MKLVGGYRVVAIGMLGSMQGFAPNDRLVALALMTGETSSFAGIGFVYPEALVRQTALASAEVEAALANLEKLPSPSNPFIIRDSSVIWIRNQLKSDPTVKKAGGKPNAAQQLGIQRHVGSLPQDNRAVRKFLRHYREMLNKAVADTDRGTKGKTVGGTVGGTVGESPASTPASTTSPAASPPRTVAHATTKDNRPVPAHWFNDCDQGQRQACIKTIYLDQVKVAGQCDDHAAARTQRTRPASAETGDAVEEVAYWLTRACKDAEDQSGTTR
jgi:hypothetical protein